MIREANTHTRTSASRGWAARLQLGYFALVLAVLVSALVADASLARTTRLHQGPLNSTSGAGPLVVDQSNGDVYVGGRRFTAAGAPKNFTAGPSAGTNQLPGYLLAIDNSGGPMNGTIYAAPAGLASVEKATVEIYASTGASLGTITGSGTKFGKFGNTIHGIAVDQSSGALYISEGAGLGQVWRYSPSFPAGSIDDADYTLAGISALVPTDLAADSGNVYVIEGVQGGANKTILAKYAASSFGADFEAEPAHTTVDTGELSFGPKALAVDPENGDLYVNEGHRVSVYDSSSSPLYNFGLAAYFGNNSEAVAVKSAASGPAEKAYVTDPQPGGQEIDVFGPLASAKTFTRLEVSSFGPDGTPNSSFSHHNFGSLAFDQAARRLYAVDAGVPGVFGFDASSPPVFPPAGGFSPLATAATGSPSSGNAPGLAIDNTALSSARNLYLASGVTDLIYGWSSAASPLGGAFPVDPEISPGPPDGSPRDLCGATVDSQGNLWVANRQTKRILKYSSAGASLPGAIDTSTQGPPCQLVFDSDDDLYVNIIGSGVWKYTTASGYSSATRIAAASSFDNNIWLATDPSSDHLFVTVGEVCSNICNIRNWVDEYDAAGNLIDEFATRSGPSFSGIAVDATNHGVYIADRAGRKIHAFGPSALLPEVMARPASARTNTSATMNGLVNTQAVALTDCHFEYVTEEAFRLTGFSDLGSGGSVPCTPAHGSIPLDLADNPVSATAAGLTENTTYRFRLSASNADGTDTAEEAFSSAGRPIVETTGSPVRSATTARLEGRVFAHGEATTYHFEYGTEGPCDANPCESTEARSVGSGDEIQLVSQLVEGLEPSTTYHYRLIADNGNPLGSGVGNGMTVTTRTSDAALSHGDFPGPPGSDRAWEQVSLPDTGGNPVPVGLAVSDDGNRAFYNVSGGTPISNTGAYVNSIYAERTETAPHQGSWRSFNLGPPREQLAGGSWFSPNGKLDLSDQVAVNTDAVTSAGSIWRLRPGHPAALVFQTTLLGNPVAVSEDASRVIVRGKGSLDPAYPLPPEVLNLYDVSSGTPKLVGLLPNGSLPPCTALLEGGFIYASRAASWLSADGSLLFFLACSNLYVRDLDAEQTKLIANSSSFVKSTPDAAFFITAQSIEPSDAGGRDVYRYDLSDEAMKCVTCVAAPGLQADVNHAVVAADGSRAYFTTVSALLPGAATPGMYRVEVGSGDLAYVGPAGDFLDEDVENGNALAPDGAALVFASKDHRLNAIGGQQNGGTLQYYRYDDRDRSLICLSCPQDGGAPVSPVKRSLLSTAFEERAGANKTALSADGQTFAFATPTALLGPDQNTARSGQEPAVGTDVYEWRDGRLLLITDGLIEWPAQSPPYVSAITPSGDDVLFTAAAQYTKDALDAYMRLYDARIGGGFEFPPPPRPCPLEVCQGTPRGAPEEQEPSTGNFSGSANKATNPPGRRPCPKGRHKARKGGKVRCIKSQGKKQRKQRQRAKHDRRAQR